MRQRGDDFGTIGIGVPYFRASYEFFRWWSWLLVGGLRPGDMLLNDDDVPGEMPIPLAHNALVAQFLRYPMLDTLCIVEDDHCGQQDAIDRLRDKPDNWQYDIVCASYVNRRGQPVMVGANFTTNEPNAYGEVEVELRPFDVAETGTQPYDVAALGLVLIRRWVLEAMQGDKPAADTFWFDWRGRNSQDMQFYWQAKMLGAKTAVDRDVQLGHIGKKVYHPREFYASRARQIAQNQEV